MHEGRGPFRVIIDTDPGVDDALALLLALRSPEATTLMCKQNVEIELNRIMDEFDANVRRRARDAKHAARQGAK